MIARHQQPEKAKENGRTADAGKSANGKSTRPKSANGNKSNGNCPSSPVAEAFRRFAHKTSEFVGSPWTFGMAFAAIVAWAVLGPVFGFSDTWQLVINTATTIVTFLMVFLIQNTQNRDAKAMHLKLDELIHAVKGARNKLIDLENLSDEEVAKIQEQFKRLGKIHQARRETSSQSNAEKK